ncbi:MULTISPECIES: Fe(3+)-hydroxamate ABC transporter substrate-binding protein FhuD [unclassified Tatumella]|uniref:Fe(3+)-hydroxamate ABC transporter substrate-binding protein FhuD n=1 Tax=unclassified Tatumella TaxID=2649542 RepID=UPI001BAFF112|nr:MULTISPECIES: Fe(3+)-hydroxamate ABC transporter substrate-binding protein FhuD [unclassified Tatumella]MBS0876135.1 Fe(3+)-hydroxamate ABC transporter substrate-binding protein FhuD [Tatumella sp. JGM82]MBS0889183.1 Fe(3+)-hydroxamate ABC transporter substrate-binding protein FhuD [Tatumella sp. JGM94]MBS0901065.1 Fe(3+)-hydroxamate ABC transporter substrate-binding protein FhuD [Tatumella sp. JGM100]
MSDSSGGQPALFSRRQLLRRSALLLAAAGLPSVCRAVAAPPLSPVAALEWSAVEMLYVLGLTPMAVSDISGYNNWVSAPPVPPQVTELGLRTEPNLELLYSLAPRLLLLPQHSPLSVSRLQQIAPVWQYPFAVAGSTLLSVARQNILQLADRLERQPVAQQYLHSFDQQMAVYRQQLQPLAGKKVLMFTLMSPRQALVLTRDSLFGEVVTATGLQSAWQGSSSIWGSVIVGIEQLLTCQADIVLQFSHGDQGLTNALSGSPVWQQIPFNLQHRRRLIEPIWLYGSLYSALRFAGKLVQTAEEYRA